MYMTVCARKRAAPAQALVAAPAGLRRAHRGVKSPTTPMIFCGPTGSEGDLVCVQVIELRAVRGEVNQVGSESNSDDLGDLGATMSAKIPVPQWISMRWVGGDASVQDRFANAGMMASGTYKVNVTSICIFAISCLSETVGEGHTSHGRERRPWIAFEDGGECVIQTRWRGDG